MYYRQYIFNLYDTTSFLFQQFHPLLVFLYSLKMCVIQFCLISIGFFQLTTLVDEPFLYHPTILIVSLQTVLIIVRFLFQLEKVFSS